MRASPDAFSCRVVRSGGQVRTGRDHGCPGARLEWRAALANFAGQGIWTRVNNGAWTQLHYLNSSAIAIGDIDGDAQQRKDIIISFPGNGVYARLNFSSWLLLHPLNSPVLGVIDLEKNGKDDVIMNLSGNGTWIWKNNAHLGVVASIRCNSGGDWPIRHQLMETESVPLRSRPRIA